MRKSFVLALALVLALAGSSFAATLQWGGEFSAKADYNSGFKKQEDAKFFGKYDLTQKLELNFTLQEVRGAWDASFALSALDPKGLGKYTVNVNEDAFKLTAWGNYGTGHIGHKGDALEFLTISGDNTAANPKFRLSAGLGGFDVTGQVEAGKVAVNAEGDLGGFVLGATAEHNSADVPYNRFALYGGASFGILDVDAAFATNGKQKDNNTAYGVKLGSQITEAFSAGFRYTHDAGKYDDNDDNVKSGYGVEGTFKEGLLLATVSYDVETDAKSSAAAIGATYRGSEGNVAFNQLFAGAHYFKNEAFAFGGSYKMDTADDKPASAIKLQGTGPVIPGQFWLLGTVTLEQNDKGFKASTGYPADPGLVAGKDAWNKDDGGWKVVVGNNVKQATVISVDGYAPVGKLVFKPRVESGRWSDVTLKVVEYDKEDKATGTEEDFSGNVSKLSFSLAVDYKVSDGATINAKFGQDSYAFDGDVEVKAPVNRYNSFGVSVSF